MVLDTFHPLVSEWFERRFGTPTDAQEQGWPAIASGRHTLIAAPTGSGKTLAAFLTALDSLVRQALSEDGLPDQTQVLYVSPLKALANDIQRNLLDPLAELRELAAERGTPLPEIRAAVRTGDTPQKERTLHVRRPPHVLITTPESLFILLTSERGRTVLKSVRTLILDELHAVAPNKRGAHLALSVERLTALAEQPITRIGLSATQKPIEEVGYFLTAMAGSGASVRPHASGTGGRNVGFSPEGAKAPADHTRALPVIVNTGHKRHMDLGVVLPDDHELGPIATHEQWAQVLDQIAEMVQEHRTTLVFVNTRRLVERVAHLLSDRLGEENVVAHHGSLSKETRFEAEQRLKAGDVKVCVATASLELGIDVGDIDLTCLIGSPRNIGVALQRIGRSGHWRGGTPKGRLFPLTRDELVETVALLRAISAGVLDALHLPPWPLDVLAQQVVAACVNEEWAEDDLFELVTSAYPYRELPRDKYDEVVAMLSDGVANKWGRSSAYLHRDGVNHVIKGRRGARLAAITSGGAIPDNADYLVIAEPDGGMVGTVNEDFAIESNAGDIFLLGNTPWKIRRVESGVVRVESAIGQSPTIPFWLGEAPGRTIELSEEVSQLREGIDERLPVTDTAVAWVMEGGVSQDVAEQIVEYVAEGKRVLGMVPTTTRLIAERFFDEAGGMQLVIHSPLGSRINRAWGLALRKRFCVGFNFELQAAATDEGINIALGPQHSFPVEEVFRYVKSPTAHETLLQAVLQSPIFPIRWRWTISRALALLRQTGGKRVPTPIQRMRSDDLLAAVFPDAAACQDNMPAGMNITPPDHPLVFETVRDCLTEALDFEGMLDLIGRIERGEIEVYGKDTVQPSAFSHQILNAMPYAFLDDAPLEERRARAVSLRRALPEDANDLGTLDQDVIATESAHAWPAIRDADELHDALLSLGVLTPEDVGAKADDPARWQAWFDGLADAGRVQTRQAGQRTLWLATERIELVDAAYGDADDAIEAKAEILRGRAESTGPFTVSGMAALLGFERSDVAQGVLRLEAQGVVLRGRFTLDAPEEEYCDRRILARIHRNTIGKLRRDIEPVPVASYIRFLTEWQHVVPGARLVGEAGMLEVVDQLQGFEAAAATWESDLLKARLSDFQPATVDALCFSGDLAWGRFTRRDGPAPSVGLSRNGPVSLALREDVPWLLDPPANLELTGAAADVRDHLAARGASFFPDIVEGTRRLPSEVEDGLWQLVAAGIVTADGFGALRGLVSGMAKKVQRRSRFDRRSRPSVSLGRAGSRWSLLQGRALTGAPDLGSFAEQQMPGAEGRAVDFSPEAAKANGRADALHPRASAQQQVPSVQSRNVNFSPEVAKATADQTEERAAQLLRRYGVVMREVLAREPMAPPWGQLVRVFRRAEARGEVRGGRFIAGLVGEQFAMPEAVDALRAVHRREPAGQVVRVSACDPLNLVGILTPGARVPAVPGNTVTYRDGVPLYETEAVEVTGTA